MRGACVFMQKLVGERGRVLVEKLQAEYDQTFLNVFALEHVRPAHKDMRKIMIGIKTIGSPLKALQALLKRVRSKLLLVCNIASAQSPLLQQREMAKSRMPRNVTDNMHRICSEPAATLVSLCFVTRIICFWCYSCRRCANIRLRTRTSLKHNNRSRPTPLQDFDINSCLLVCLQRQSARWFR